MSTSADIQSTQTTHDAVYTNTHLLRRNLLQQKINKLVRPGWPYDMRPSVRAEKYMCVIVIR